MTISIYSHAQYCGVNYSMTNHKKPSSDCGSDIDFSDYRPTEINAISSKEVNLIFHIVQDGDQLNNFTENDIGLLHSYVEDLNQSFTQIPPLVPAPSQLSCATQFIPDSKIKFRLASIKFYSSNDFFCTTTSSFCCGDEDGPLTRIYNALVRDNNDLTLEERLLYFPVIIVGEGGILDCNDDCSDPNREISGVGFSDFNLLSGIYNNKTDIKKISRIIGHELGHTLGLTHSWADSDAVSCNQKIYQCCDLGNREDTNNFMDYDFELPFNNSNTLIDCQIGIMHYHLENTHSQYLAQSLCDKQEEVATISASRNICWATEKTLSQDLHIYGTLNVKCRLSIANDVSIIVHRGGVLNIEGAELTSCDNKWNGIIVEGFSGLANNSTNGAGKVTLSNDAAIENAKIGINTHLDHLSGWNPEFWGGYINATNATFRNCDRGIAFMRHGQNRVQDQSYLEKSIFLIYVIQESLFGK